MASVAGLRNVFVYYLLGNLSKCYSTTTVCTILLCFDSSPLWLSQPTSTFESGNNPLARKGTFCIWIVCELISNFLYRLLKWWWVSAWIRRSYNQDESSAWIITIYILIALFSFLLFFDIFLISRKNNIINALYWTVSLMRNLWTNFALEMSKALNCPIPFQCHLKANP